jgi:hypothetical protein
LGIRGRPARQYGMFADLAHVQPIKHAGPARRFAQAIAHPAVGTGQPRLIYQAGGAG